jgi:hypothetical protein
MSTRVKRAYLLCLRVMKTAKLVRRQAVDHKCAIQALVYAQRQNALNGSVTPRQIEHIRAKAERIERCMKLTIALIDDFARELTMLRLLYESYPAARPQPRRSRSRYVAGLRDQQRLHDGEGDHFRPGEGAGGQGRTPQGSLDSVDDAVRQLHSVGLCLLRDGSPIRPNQETGAQI